MVVILRLHASAVSDRNAGQIQPACIPMRFIKMPRLRDQGILKTLYFSIRTLSDYFHFPLQALFEE